MSSISEKSPLTVQKKSVPIPLAAFLLGSVLFTILLIINNFLSVNGSSMCLGDSFDQYIAFIESFIRVLRGEQDFWYSFSLYAGSGSVLTYTYYCLSPFNLLYMIPGLSIITVTHIISVIKVGLAAAAFAWYSEAVLKQEKIASIFFSLCYAFCSWAVIMSINYMWADSLYTLPVLILLLSRFIKKTGSRNFILLSLCYAYLFITNFYMGYIAGIFTALYFISTAICNELQETGEISVKQHILNVVKKTFIFISSVILAAALDAALLLPSGYFLVRHLRGVTESFIALPATLPDIFGTLFAGSGAGLYSITPYFYCGLPVLLLFPFYFFIKDISFSKKVSAAVMLLFYLCGSMVLPLYAFLHAFDNPDHYPFRFSPCVVFILVSLAGRVWTHRTGLKIRSMSLAAGGMCAAYAFLVLFNAVTGYSSVSDTLLVINAAFIGLWLVIFIINGKKPSGDNDHMISKYLPFAALILLAAELLVSSTLSIRSFAGTASDSNTRIDEASFDSWYKAESSAVRSLKASDPGLYRVRIDGERCFNGASLFGANTLTSFASYEEKAQRQAFADLGIGNAYHMLYDINDVSLTDMLFAVKYHIDISGSDDQQDFIIKANETALPIAYTVSSDIASYKAGPDPFTNMNNLVSSMTGHPVQICETVPKDKIITDSFNTNVYDLGDMTAFDIMTDSINKGWATFAIPKDESKKIYAYFTPSNGTYYNSLSPYIMRGTPIGLNCALTIAGGSVYEVNRTAESAEFNSSDRDFNENDYIYMILYINTEGYSSYAVNDINFAYYDEEAINDAYAYLSEGAMQLNAYSDSHIEGTVTATEERPLLFTSIPYDKGWSAYVDGTPTKIYVTLDDAFCTLALAPGDHSIVFDYEAPYAFIGKILSVSAVFILLCIYLKGSKKKLKNDKPENKVAESESESETAE